MFTYAMDYEDSKKQLFAKIEFLRTQGFEIITSTFEIMKDLQIDKIHIKSKSEARNRLVFDIGLHGIEGYVGHSCLMVFLDEYLSLLGLGTEVIIYHAINPFGMKHYRRNNENNVDLNRNFSSNDFNSNNPDFEKAVDFFKPKRYKGIFRANLSFYLSVINMVLKYGASTLKAATLLGQKIAQDAIYYSSSEYQRSTKYMLNEIQLNMNNIDQVVWIDLHTGYGPRYQMSIVNSKQEKEINTEFSHNIHYPLVLGLNANDFYEIDGDMIEMIYTTHAKMDQPNDLYGTCFEFGTLGESLLKSIKSLKAMLFENSSYFIPQNNRFRLYAEALLKEQFLPSEQKWREKAYQDFKQAISGILEYKKLI